MDWSSSRVLQDVNHLNDAFRLCNVENSVALNYLRAWHQNAALGAKTVVAFVTSQNLFL